MTEAYKVCESCFERSTELICIDNKGVATYKCKICGRNSYYFVGPISNLKLKEDSGMDTHVLVSIEIPNNMELADAVMRQPKPGEFYLGWEGAIMKCTPDTVFNLKLKEDSGMDTHVLVSIEIPNNMELADARLDMLGYKAPILRKKWKWPEWLKAPAIAMDASGSWYAYTSIPEMRDNDWSNLCTNTRLHRDLLEIELPMCANWKESLMKNPNYKGNE